MGSPPRTQPSGGAWLIVLGSLGVVVVWMLWVNGAFAPSTVASQAPTAAPTQDCSTAIPTVRAYKASGQTSTLDDEAMRSLRNDYRPTQARDWIVASRGAGYCVVALRATVGNEDRQFQWRLETASKRVTAVDAEAKRLAGW